MNPHLKNSAREHSRLFKELISAASLEGQPPNITRAFQDIVDTFGTREPEANFNALAKVVIEGKIPVKSSASPALKKRLTEMAALQSSVVRWAA